jgi:hypothetical protein
LNFLRRCFRCIVVDGYGITGISIYGQSWACAHYVSFRGRWSHYGQQSRQHEWYVQENTIFHVQAKLIKNDYDIQLVFFWQVCNYIFFCNGLYTYYTLVLSNW